MLLKRMVTYLYEYRNGMKGIGAGFLKLDSRGKDCRVQLYLQGKNVGEDHGMVYFVVRQEELIGLFLGEVTVRQEAIGGSWIVDCESICGSPWSFSDVEGMAVLYPSGRYLASCWVEEPDEDFLRGKFKPWSNRVSQGVTEQKTQLEGQGSEKQLPETQESEVRIPEEQLPETQESEARIPEEQLPEAQESEKKVPEEQAHEKQFPQAQEPKELISKGPERRMQIEQLHRNSYKTERIDISDIRRFPKKNWYLCSNSFVIHGFFNYHYLVRIHREEGGLEQQYLGVPGVYAKPERAMAMLFGFPEFEPLQDQNIKAQKNAAEEVPEGTFGYWCCRLEM